MPAEKPHILLTNDDGIESPGLWAAAEALALLGFVHVVAPRDQSTGAGRSLPSQSDGRIRVQSVEVHGKSWEVYAVGGTPAQAVLHAALEILPAPPQLVVSGINYGENLGTGVTISGTVGAALEGAALGVAALAISLETPKANHLSYSKEVDFSTAAHFTGLFSRLLLARPLPFDVDVLKVDVPSSATPATPWRVTRLSRQRYYESLRPKRTSWEEPGQIDYRQAFPAEEYEPGTDIHTLLANREVSVTPLSLDLTSRVDFAALAALLAG